MEKPAGADPTPGRWYHPPARLMARQRIATLSEVAGTMAAGEAGLTPAVAAARRMLEHARRELDRRGRLSGILRPGDVEALAAVDAAEYELVRSSPENYRLATLSAVVHRARTELPPDDAARAELASLITRKGPPTAAHLDAMMDALRQADERRRRALIRMGTLTRLVLAGAALAAAAAVGLAVFGGLRPGVWPTCFQPAPAPAQVCLTGSAPAGRDLVFIEALGLVGAFISALVTARPLRDVTLPTRLALLAMALKLPVGMLLAPTVLLLIARGAVPGLSALDSGRQIIGWSLALGCAQQVLTAALDRRFVQLGLRTSRWYESVLPATLPSAGQKPPTPRPPTVHRYRLLCVGITLAATAAAFVPLALAMARWLPAALGIGAALLVAAQGVRRSPPRRVLGGWARFVAQAVYRAATGACVAALVVLFVYLATRAFAGDGSAALITATAVAAILGLVVGAEVQADIGHRRLGGTPHPGPVALPRLRDRWVRIALTVVSVVVVALLAGTGHGTSVPVWTGTALLVTVGFAVAARRDRPVAGRAWVEDAGTLRDELVEVLDRDGWQVVLDPQLGYPQVDPLLGRVDLLLRRQEQALAVQILTAGPDERRTGWRAASELLIATNALERLMRRSPVDIAPVMVLVDTEPDNSLQGLAHDRSLHLVEIRRESGRAFADQLREKLAGLRRATAPQG